MPYLPAEISPLVRKLRAHCAKRGLRYKTPFWSPLFNLQHIHCMNDRARRNALTAALFSVRKIEHDLERYAKFFGPSGDWLSTRLGSWGGELPR